ncbi:hypothetical protein D3C79_819780 [compost metagenome]
MGAQRHWGFAHQQRRDDRWQHQHTEQHIGAGPGFVQIAETGRAKAFGEEQGTRGGQQRSNPIAGHVAGSEGGLALIVGDFQAVGVDSDVLGG